MIPRTLLFVSLFTLVLIGGCIVSDQLTTLTISPDGSAEYVVFRSNIRSSEPGDRGQYELANYKEQFENREEDELSRITKAGGQIVSASWIRQQPPYSNFVQANFPNSSVLERFLSDDRPGGNNALTTQFRVDGARRRLTMKVTMHLDSIPSVESDLKSLRQKNAEAISEMRFAVSEGSITSARGFTVAPDQKSALFDMGAFAELLRSGQGKAEFHLEWEISR